MRFYALPELCGIAVVVLQETTEAFFAFDVTLGITDFFRWKRKKSPERIGIPGLFFLY
jgi:hypothetical protein